MSIPPYVIFSQSLSHAEERLHFVNTSGYFMWLYLWRCGSEGLQLMCPVSTATLFCLAPTATSGGVLPSVLTALRPPLTPQEVSMLCFNTTTKIALPYSRKHLIPIIQNVYCSLDPSVRQSHLGEHPITPVISRKY